jgi:hypothetical protein
MNRLWTKLRFAKIFITAIWVVAFIRKAPAKTGIQNDNRIPKLNSEKLPNGPANVKKTHPNATIPKTWEFVMRLSNLLANIPQPQVLT